MIKSKEDEAGNHIQREACVEKGVKDLPGSLIR